MWDQLTRVVVVLLLLAALTGAVVWTLPLMSQNERLRKEVMHREGEIHQEEETQKRLRSALEAQKDPKTVERRAREQLGYAKPGETVVRFEAAVTNAPATR